MPGHDESEAISTAQILGIDVNVMKENFTYMKGIARYLFKPGATKHKIQSAVLEVSAPSITKMVSMQASNREGQLVSVHSLVLWKKGTTYTDPPGFELVSRYAEHLVAKELATETMEDLKNARRNMAPLSGAEGYAGALFEAYAVRTLQYGGSFKMRSLEDATVSDTLEIPALKTAPIVVEENKLTSAVVPYNSVRVPETGSATGLYSPRLLWPSTTNFPSFDCFYFGTDGRVFPLQMTVARTHKLETSGAANAKQYLDGLLKKNKPAQYPAVFVVPIDICHVYEKQGFTGNVNGKPADYGPSFCQWVIGV